MLHSSSCRVRHASASDGLHRASAGSERGTCTCGRVHRASASRYLRSAGSRGRVCSCACRYLRSASDGVHRASAGSERGTSTCDGVHCASASRPTVTDHGENRRFSSNPESEEVGPPLPDESAPSMFVPAQVDDELFAVPVSGATPVDDEPPVSKSRLPLPAEPGPPTFETESVVEAPPVGEYANAPGTQKVVESGQPLPAESAPSMFVATPVVKAPPVDVQPACEVEYTTPAPAVTRMAPAPAADYVDPAAVDPGDQLWQRFWSLDLEQQLELESRFLALPPAERRRVFKLRCPR